MKRLYSPTKQKILLLLMAGAAFGLTRSYNRQRRIIKETSREWKEINRRYLYRTLREFKENRLIDYREDENGITHITLSEEGKRRVLSFEIDNLSINQPKKWDGIWRVVFYDVPEKKKSGREALRSKLKELGFKEWQKSVFVFPFPCQDQIDFLVEFFELRPYVRYAEITKLTNAAELKLYFNLT